MTPFKRTNRLAAGGLVVVVAAIATWLSGLFSGFGGGGSDGNGSVSVQIPDTGSVDVNVSHTEPAPERENDPEPAAQAADGVVDVVIEEQSYFLRDGGELQPVELAKLVAMARDSRGNEDGIRVRITRAASSRPSAEETLINELLDAGVPQEALLLRDGF